MVHWLRLINCKLVSMSKQVNNDCTAPAFGNSHSK